jgi:tetratricopeptide (TPR) repeat protein
MADTSRIDDLRRRVQKDPASIAFAQLAEECRRAGDYQEAVDACHAGLEIHPGYLSARVTLGRALVELGALDEALIELSRVLESAPENLAAIRGLAEIYHRRGDLPQALAQYRSALLLARNDPDLEQTIADLSRQIEPAKPAPSGGLTLQHMQDELLKLAPPPPKPVPKAEPAIIPGEIEAAAPIAPPPAGPVAVPDALFAEAPAADPLIVVMELSPVDTQETRAVEPSYKDAFGSYEGSFGAADDVSGADQAVLAEDEPVVADAPALMHAAGAIDSTLTPAVDDRATRTVAALEQWLAAIHVPRDHRDP